MVSQKLPQEKGLLLRRIQSLTLCNFGNKMQAADARCRELSCALLLALTCPTSEKTPQRNPRCASWVAVAWETPLCAEQRLYNILSALWGREPLDASLLLGLSVAFLHMVNYQCQSVLAKKGFFSVLHLQSKVIP